MQRILTCVDTCNNYLPIYLGRKLVNFIICIHYKNGNNSCHGKAAQSLKAIAPIGDPESTFCRWPSAA